MIDFEMLYQKVKPIVLKCRRQYHIQQWEYEDWQQEGRLILFALLEDFPDLFELEGKAYRYFKTKFTSHLKDTVRAQESLKRQYHKMAYDEISEVGHLVSSQEMVLDDYVAYYDVLDRVREGLGDKEKRSLDRLLDGERFEGRKALLRKMAPWFIDFREG